MDTDMPLKCHNPNPRAGYRFDKAKGETPTRATISVHTPNESPGHCDFQ